MLIVIYKLINLDRITIIKKNNHIYLKFMCIIFIISFSIQVTDIVTQTSDFNNYGATYKVHIGDTMSYKYTKIDFNGSNYLTNYLPLTNGESVEVNVTQGSTIKVQVTNINETDIYVYLPNGSYSYQPVQTVYIQSTYYISGKTYIAPETYGSTIIFPAFDNRTIVDKYVTYMNEMNSNNSNGLGLVYHADNSLIYGEQNYNGVYQGLAYDWHSGWLQYLEYKIGTSTDLRVDIVGSSDLLNSLLSNSIVTNFMYAFVIGSPMAIGAFFMYSFMNYKKSSSRTVSNASKSSFSSYVKNNVKRKRVTKTNQPPQVEKSLNIIEDILNENK